MLELAVSFLVLSIIATFAGGLAALRLKKRLKLLVAFSAGLLVGVAFFDLLPEAFGLSEARFVSISIALGFLLYLVLERFILMHACEGTECGSERHSHPSAIAAIFGLVFHRFLDGLVIMLSFKAGVEIGFLVALAIVVHSVPDGVNSITVLLLKKRQKFLQWFIALAIAVFAGAGLGFFLPLQENQLGFLIAFIAGWFLYLGASDLLPEVHREERSIPALAATILGFVLIAIVTGFFSF